MIITLSMWSNLTRLASHHLNNGFRDYPQPWIASQEAMFVTLPEGASPTVLHGEDLLIGSAEQAFIDRMIHNDGFPTGKWQALTPCFRREESYDAIRHPYFMKLELINYAPKSVQSALDEMIALARGGFELLTDEPILLTKTEVGWDLTLHDIEVGSYGTRTYGKHQWVYGTGIAEPRFTAALYNRPGT